jgi:hypothetical protein
MNHVLNLRELIGAISRPILVDMCNGSHYHSQHLHPIVGPPASEHFFNLWEKIKVTKTHAQTVSKENLMTFYASQFHE